MGIPPPIGAQPQAMPLTPRCLISNLAEPDLRVDRASVHHFERVLRLQPGEPIELVDGRGGLARALWGRKGALTQIKVAPRAAPPTATFVLAVAPPKPTRLDWLVEKAAELGVSRLQLLRTQHSGRDVSPSRLERLSRKAGEAMMQCRRLHQMEVAASASLEDVLNAWSGAPPWLASPGATVTPAVGSATEPPPLLGLVGPEGGWHDDELTLAHDSGAVPVSLGSGILRVETAALALAVLAQLRGLSSDDERGGSGHSVTGTGRET